MDASGRASLYLLKGDPDLTAAVNRWTAVFDAAPVGMAEVGLDGMIRRVNPAFCQVSGRAADELAGTAVVDLFHRDDVDQGSVAVAALHRGDETRQNVEVRVVDTQGCPAWVHVSSVAMRGSDGHVDHTLVYLLDVSDRKRLESRLQAMADRDGLTGLPNLRTFEAELGRHVAHGVRYGPQGALLFVDLDHFKEVNDILGHRAGDDVIVSIAKLLRRRLRTTDIVGRLGGDEFGVILPRVNQSEAEIVAANIVSAIRSDIVVSAELPGSRLTASVGIVMFDDSELSPADMLVAADVSMFAAKRGGRDRFSVYRPPVAAMMPS